MVLLYIDCYTHFAWSCYIFHSGYHAHFGGIVIFSTLVAILTSRNLVIFSTSVAILTSRGLVGAPNNIGHGARHVTGAGHPQAGIEPGIVEPDVVITAKLLQSFGGLVALSANLGHQRESRPSERFHHGDDGLANLGRGRLRASEGRVLRFVREAGIRTVLINDIRNCMRTKT